MGRQARLKQERRLAREHVGPSMGSEPLRILRGIHKTIQSHCYESGRRCWEYLLEMIAHSSGWDTETCEARHLWDKMANENRWGEFFEAWMEEVTYAKANGAPFSEPLGQLLEEIEGTNDSLGQFLTPMPVVRMMNAITMADSYEPPQPNGMPSTRGLDPCCGTGRFMIDALVHDDGVAMHGIDLDNWMLRCAKLNVRLLAKWTNLRMRDQADLLKPLRKARNILDQFIQTDALATVPQSEPEPAGDTILIGGRAIFMHGNALILDLEYASNWLCAGWAWTPRPWEENLKIRGFYGCYNHWIEAGRPPLDESGKTNKVQYDYSMTTEKQSAP